MDDSSLLRSLGVVRPTARDALVSFNDVFPDVPRRTGERTRVFDERTTIGLMLGQSLDRNAPSGVSHLKSKDTPVTPIEATRLGSTASCR